MIGEIKMNEEILARLATYRNQNWNPVIEKILENDTRFWKYETPTIDREVYFLTNQLIDILKLVKEGRIHKVQYEFADLVSMGIGYMMIYGNPLSTLEYRMSINHSVKGEKNIVFRNTASIRSRNLKKFSTRTRQKNTSNKIGM